MLMSVLVGQTSEQQVAESTLQQYSFGLCLAIVQPTMANIHYIGLYLTQP